MSTGVLIIGSSGMGKSSSMRNLDPSETLLIQPVKKMLPFPGSDKWTVFDPATRQGNVVVTDDTSLISSLIKKTKKKIIIVDDYQFVLMNEFMRRSKERGFDKFTEIAHHSWQLLLDLHESDESKTVYIMWHPDYMDDGRMVCKTAGKLLQEKIEPPSMVSICFIAVKNDGKHVFQTQSNGQDPAKTPMGMFDDMYIDNDLKMIDDRIREYCKI